MDGNGQPSPESVDRSWRAWQERREGVQPSAVMTAWALRASIERARRLELSHAALVECVEDAMGLIQIYARGDQPASTRLTEYNKDGTTSVTVSSADIAIRTLLEKMIAALQQAKEIGK